MDRMLRGLLVALLGIATTVLTAMGLVYVEWRYDTAIYSFVYGFVIPIGAFLSGLVAASGYYLGGRLFSYRPGRAMMAVLLAVSSANFFLIYWLEYFYAVVDGMQLRTYMTYPAYLAFMLTHSSLTSGPSDTGATELGVWGYLYAAMLIVGFALGGLCVWAMMRAAPYCEECLRFLKKKGSQTRYFVKREELAACNAAMRFEMERGNFRGAVQVHEGSGVRVANDTTGYQLRAGVSECRGCGKQWLQLIEAAGEQELDRDHRDEVCGVYERADWRAGRDGLSLPENRAGCGA